MAKDDSNDSSIARLLMPFFSITVRAVIESGAFSQDRRVRGFVCLHLT